MILKDGMPLYHGSYVPIEVIDLRLCAVGKDFGKGFYLTEDLKQAKSFIGNSVKKAQKTGRAPQNQDFGYVSVFRYRGSINEIPVYSFDTADKEWLWFVSMNRRSELAESFREGLKQELLLAEIIMGKIANDTTNPTIMAYLSGVFGDLKSEAAINFAIHQLLPNRLKNQYCFLSERAISCLELVEVVRYDR